MHSSPFSMFAGALGGWMARSAASFVAEDLLGINHPIARAAIRGVSAAGGHAVAAGVVNAVMIDPAAGMTTTPAGALLHGASEAIGEFTI